jgi:hypothetical protein
MMKDVAVVSVSTSFTPIADADEHEVKISGSEADRSATAMTRLFQLTLQSFAVHLYTVHVG